MRTELDWMVVLWISATLMRSKTGGACLVGGRRKGGRGIWKWIVRRGRAREIGLTGVGGFKGGLRGVERLVDDGNDGLVKVRRAVLEGLVFGGEEVVVGRGDGVGAVARALKPCRVFAGGAGGDCGYLLDC